MTYDYLDRSIEIAKSIETIGINSAEKGVALGAGGSYDVYSIGSVVLSKNEIFLAVKVPRNNDENSLMRLSQELAQATFIAQHAPSLVVRLPLFFAHIEVAGIDGGVLLTEDVSKERSKLVLRGNLPITDKQAMAEGTACLGMTYEDFDTEPADHSLAFTIDDDTRYLDFTPIFIRDFLNRQETEDVNEAVDTAIAEGLLTVSIPDDSRLAISLQ